MCWENRLYDAMIYVYNSGMNDFITPMEVGRLASYAKYLSFLIEIIFRLVAFSPSNIVIYEC